MEPIAFHDNAGWRAVEVDEDVFHRGKDLLDVEQSHGAVDSVESIVNFNQQYAVASSSSQKPRMA